MAYCPNCGFYCTDGAKFCGNCGGTIMPSQPAQPVAQPQPQVQTQPQPQPCTSNRFSLSLYINSLFISNRSSLSLYINSRSNRSPSISSRYSLSLSRRRYSLQYNPVRMSPRLRATGYVLPDLYCHCWESSS